MTDSTSKPQIAPVNLRELLLYNDRFLVVAYSATGWTAIIFLINLLHLGGNRFVQGLNSIMAMAFAVLLVAFSLRIHAKLKNESRADLLWRAILIGFGLWALVEVLRLLIMFLSPNPRFSILNWLWFLGYIPMLYGFYLHHIYTESRITDRQRQMLWGGVGLGVVYIFVTLLLPTLRGAPNRYLAGIVFSLLYALADLGLLLILIRIFFSYLGVYGGPWKFFTVAWVVKFMGLVVLQFPANFAAGVTGSNSFLFSVANFAHYYWYGFAILGLYVYEIVISHKPVSHSVSVREENVAPNASALVFTDDQDRVIRTSINFRFIMRLPEHIPTSDVPLQQLLGMSDDVYQELKAQLRKQGSVKKLVVEPSFRAGHKAWITAAVSSDPERRYNGMNMVVQVVAEGVGGSGLTNEERALVENIFFATGTVGEDSQKLLVEYFNMNYKRFSALVTEYEGSRRAAGLSEVVNQVARKQKMSVQVLEQELNVTGDLKLDDLGKAIAVLLAAARTYVINLAGQEAVRRESDHLHQEIDRSTKALVARYKLAG